MRIIRSIMKYLLNKKIWMDHVHIQEKEKILDLISSPKPLQVNNSHLKFYIHSVTEDARVRKFKEPWTIQWLRDLPKEAVLYDIGANIGITSLVPVEKMEKNIQVVAVEPAPANYIS